MSELPPTSAMRLASAEPAVARFTAEKWKPALEQTAQKFLEKSLNMTAGAEAHAKRIADETQAALGDTVVTAEELRSAIAAQMEMNFKNWSMRTDGAAAVVADRTLEALGAAPARSAAR